MKKVTNKLAKKVTKLVKTMRRLMKTSMNQLRNGVDKPFGTANKPQWHLTLPMKSNSELVAICKKTFLHSYHKLLIPKGESRPLFFLFVSYNNHTEHQFLPIK